MSDRGGTTDLTPGRHLAGASLVLCAFALLGLSVSLPSCSASSVELPFLNDDMPGLVLAFAGYPSCSSVCPTSLAAMREAWRAIEPEDRSRAAMLFVNIERNAPVEQTRAYAQAFHPDFRAWAVTDETAPVVYRELALQSYARREDAEAHTGFIYLFARSGQTWRIERVYRRAPDAAELRRDLLSHLAGPA